VSLVREIVTDVLRRDRGCKIPNCSNTQKSILLVVTVILASDASSVLWALSQIKYIWASAAVNKQFDDGQLHVSYSIANIWDI
jgi:hypothetical protein